MKSKILNYVLGAILILVLVFGGCKYSAYLGKVKEVDSLNLALQTTKKEVNLKGDTIHFQQAIIVQNNESLKKYTNSIFNLERKHRQEIKEIKAFYSENTETKIKEVKVPYIDSVGTKAFEDSVRKKCGDSLANFVRDSLVLVGTKARVDSVDYEIDLTINKDHVKIDSIVILDSQYLRFSEIKGGILKRDLSGKRRLFSPKYIRVEVFHTNNNIKIKNQNSIFYVAPKKKQVLIKALIAGGAFYLGTKL